MAKLLVIGSSGFITESSADSSGVGGSGVSLNAQTGTTYTLALTDANTDVSMTNASASTVTIPQNSSVAIPVGAQGIISWGETGAGQPTIAAGTGATVTAPTGFTLRLRAQGSQAVWEKTATNTFRVSGDLEPNTYTINVSLASDATANSTTTAASITGLETVLGVGTYTITAWIRYVAAATTTGAKFAIDHSGTTTMFLATALIPTTGTTAVTTTATQNSPATAVLPAVFTTRTKATLLGPWTDLDATTDQFCIIYCMLTVSVSGTLKLMHGSEVAASSTVKAGTNLQIVKVG